MLITRVKEVIITKSGILILTRKQYKNKYFNNIFIFYISLYYFRLLISNV